MPRRLRQPTADEVANPYAPVVRLIFDRVADAPANYGTITKPEDIAERVAPLIVDSPDEHLMVVLLSTRHNVLGVVEIAHGTQGHVPVNVSAVLRPAIVHGAPAFVLVHNHPSGDPSPSQNDITMTRTVVEACKLMGLRLVDHVIVGSDAPAVSLREQIGWTC